MLQNGNVWFNLIKYKIGVSLLFNFDGFDLF